MSTVLTEMQQLLYRPVEVAAAVTRAIAAQGAPLRVTCAQLEKLHCGPRASSCGFTLQHHLADVQALVKGPYRLAYTPPKNPNGRDRQPAWLTVEISCRT